MRPIERLYAPAIAFSMAETPRSLLSHPARQPAPCRAVYRRA
jgi:hypothetical protein